MCVHYKGCVGLYINVVYVHSACLQIISVCVYSVCVAACFVWFVYITARPGCADIQTVSRTNEIRLHNTSNTLGSFYFESWRSILSAAVDLFEAFNVLPQPPVECRCSVCQRRCQVSALQVAEWTVTKYTSLIKVHISGLAAGSKGHLSKAR